MTSETIPKSRLDELIAYTVEESDRRYRDITTALRELLSSRDTIKSLGAMNTAGLAKELQWLARAEAAEAKVEGLTKERDTLGQMLAPETLTEALKALAISSEAGIDTLRKLVAAESSLASVTEERDALIRDNASYVDAAANEASRADRIERNRDMWKGQCERQAADLTKMREALTKPFALVFLDGRNEHGSHVLPSLPTNLPDEYEADLPEFAEQILQEAEANGFAVGQHVWTEWRFNSPQIGDEGRVELPGYWEFARINSEMSRILSAEVKP